MLHTANPVEAPGHILHAANCSPLTSRYVDACAVCNCTQVHMCPYCAVSASTGPNVRTIHGVVKHSGFQMWSTELSRLFLSSYRTRNVLRRNIVLNMFSVLPNPFISNNSTTQCTFCSVERNGSTAQCTISSVEHNCSTTQCTFCSVEGYCSTTQCNSAPSDVTVVKHNVHCAL